jgi:hypothetical protein
VFPVRYGQTIRVEQSFKQKTRRRIMSRNVIVIVIYHCHKPQLYRSPRPVTGMALLSLLF